MERPARIDKGFFKEPENRKLTRRPLINQEHVYTFELWLAREEGVRLISDWFGDGNLAQITIECDAEKYAYIEKVWDKFLCG